jgi:AcrR family transcriptional regulator
VATQAGSEQIDTAGDEHVASAAERPLRSDARRNRDALLQAAIAAFTEHGVDASLEDVARRAGVGIGTLYRHFPTRDALVEAAYRRGVEQLCARATELAATNPPERALEQWMLAFVGYIATKRGLASVLRATADAHTELFAYVHGLLHSTLASLLDAAAAEGTIRNDVDGPDLMRALGGICMANSDSPQAGDQSRRLVALLMDGMRYGAVHRARS